MGQHVAVAEWACGFSGQPLVNTSGMVVVTAKQTLEGLIVFVGAKAYCTFSVFN